MKKQKEFPFEGARRVLSSETKVFRAAIEAKTGVKRERRGRPAKGESSKFKQISIRIHPVVIEWAKKEAAKRKIGYQTLINEILLKKAVA